MTARKAPALAIPLPGGAVLRRPAGQPGQPLTCSRCGKSSAPATIDNLDQIAAWAERHRGAEGCEP